MPLVATIRGILAPEMTDQRDEILELLTKAYWMEIETVISYLAASTNPDGVRAREVAASLDAEVQDELTHASVSLSGSRSCTAQYRARWISSPIKGVCSRRPTPPTSNM